MKVYIAAPIAKISEKTAEQINKIKSVLIDLEPNWVILHDPSKQKVPNARGMSNQERARCVFTLDIIAIDTSDWVIVCDFGRDGTAWTARECWYAFAKEKNILIIYMHDNDYDYSLMMHWCSTNFCKYTDFISTPSNKIIKKFLYPRGKLENEDNFK